MLGRFGIFVVLILVISFFTEFPTFLGFYLQSSIILLIFAANNEY